MTKRILANDGIAAEGRKMLEAAGFEVITDKVAQDALAGEVNNYDGLIVRSATKVNKSILEGAERLKLVVRAGVGMDNVDQEAATARGVAAKNTPNSSSLSVAELAIAHLAGMVRFLHQSNREMAANGVEKFNDLKKQYSDGIELRGKTLGIIGFGRIGQETAKLAVGLGMKVMGYSLDSAPVKLRFDHLPFQPVPELEVAISSLEDVIANSDFISLHAPHSEGMPALIDETSFLRMKKGVGIVNCARGGVIDEAALLKALDNGQVAYAALDVFEGEPKPRAEVLSHPKVSLTPHIGASTREAQDRVGQEVAQVVIDYFKNNGK